MSIENTPSSRGKIPLLVGAEREELLRRTDIARALDHVAGSIPIGSYVTMEGTPMYFGQPWNANHEFGTNVLAADLSDRIEARGLPVDHFALLDDYTVNVNGDDGEFLTRMRRNPDVVFRESAFEHPARRTLLRLEREGKLTPGRDEELYFGDVRVQTRSGVPSCPLLDAWFQLEKMKEDGYHVIVHPTTFKPQQEQMIAMLQTINQGRVPGTVINLYFRIKPASGSYAVAKVFRTGYDGQTNRVMEIHGNGRTV